MKLGPYSSVIRATDKNGITLYLCEKDLWSANPRDAQHWTSPAEVKAVHDRIAWKAENIHDLTGVEAFLVSTDEFRMGVHL